MKKFRFLSAVMATVLLLLLLSACQPVPTEDPATLASTPSSSVTPPSSSVPPTAPTTQPTEPQVTNPNLPPVPTDFDLDDGRAFVAYDEPVIVIMPDWASPTDCLADHLYWVVKSTKECILICDEPIYSRSYATTATHIFFVKESEPTKIYVVAKGDFSNHQLFYESEYGKVNYMAILDYSSTEIDNYLQLVSNEQQFILLNMVTKENFLMMEMYYIENAHTYDIDGIHISFRGKPTKDERYGYYHYSRITGEIRIDNSL